MKACPELKETLFMDIYGDLSPVELDQWQRHLEQCPGCRDERSRLLSFLQRVREEMRAPELSPETARRIQQTIAESVRNGAPRLGRAKHFLGIPIPPLPAVIAASFLLVVLGWFGLRELRGPSSAPNMANLEAEERIIVKDMRVLENLELLEEMEVIQKLVQVVDHRDAI